MNVKLGTRVDAADLKTGGFDSVVLATGVTPRTPPIPGIDHPKVISYMDALTGAAEVRHRVGRVLPAKHPTHARAAQRW